MAKNTTKDINKSVEHLNSMSKVPNTNYTNLTVQSRCDSVYLEGVEALNDYISIAKEKATRIKMIAENLNKADKL